MGRKVQLFCQDNLKIYINYYQLAFFLSPPFPQDYVFVTLDGAFCALEEQRGVRRVQSSILHFQQCLVKCVNASICWQ